MTDTARRTADRVILLVLDGVGVGALPDSPAYGDASCNTLGHVAQGADLRVPVLRRLGLGNLVPLPGGAPDPSPLGAFGRMAERSVGKDSTIGHWELMGCIQPTAFPTYPHGFPQDVLDELSRRTGRGVIGNRPASGTRIIAELCDEHLRTGAWIVYTSADSVLQLAAHQSVAHCTELYDACRVAAEILMPKQRILRVIARPFTGEPGHLRRTSGRRDYNLAPPTVTVLDRMAEALLPVVTVGKVDSIFDGRGVTEAIHTGANRETMQAVLDELHLGGTGLLFANLVDFDMLYGHRNDPAGFASALEVADSFIGEVLRALRQRDLLLISADHGCDPTTAGTDHTREYVPVLACGPCVKPATDLGTRGSFADLGATLCEALGVRTMPVGTSFWSTIAADAAPRRTDLERQRVDWLRRRSLLDGPAG